MRRLLQILVLISATLAIVLSAVLAGYQVEQSHVQQANTVLRMAVPYQEQHPTAQAAVFFADRVKKETNGALCIQVFFDTELGTKEELLEQLQFGGVAFAMVDSMSVSQQMPKIAEQMQCPPGSTPEEIQIILDRRQNDLEVNLDQEQVHLLAVFKPDYRVIATIQPMTGPDDFAKRRLYNPGKLALQNGAEAVHIQLTELMNTVNNDFIEGAELSLLEYTQAGYFTVLPCLTVQSYDSSADLLLASNASLGALDTEQQKLLQTLAQEAVKKHTQALREAQIQAVEQLRQKRIQLYPSTLQWTSLENWPAQLKKEPWLWGGRKNA